MPVSNWINGMHVGDCRHLMRKMLKDGCANTVQCIVTSSPYWGGLRDYGMKGQFGLEPKPALHIRRMVSTFRLARELLRSDGTLWLNYGDSYMHSGGRGSQGKGERQFRRQPKVRSAIRYSKQRTGLKPKDLVGMPWRVALALQEDGWYLRSCIIWHKSNPMPESVKDRPTTAHEYIFLFAKRQNYYYDAQAVREQSSDNTHPRRKTSGVAGWDTGPGSHDTARHAAPKEQRQGGKFGKVKYNDSFNAAVNGLTEDRNMRTVWKFSTEAFNAAHFATFPRELAARCILAGSRPGDIVFDPFSGSGTALEVALGLGRRYIGLELNAEYVELFRAHRSTQMGMPI